MNSAEEKRDGKQAELPALPDDIYRMVTAANREGRFEQVRDWITGLPAGLAIEPRFQQMLGLAHRGLLDSAAAHAAFENAARQQPSDPLLAHSIARTALEAGFPAIAAFDRALQLAPSDGNVIMGRAAAQLAACKGEDALADLGAVLAGNPGWIDGHMTHARIAAINGEAPGPTIRAALEAAPKDPQLWKALIHIHLGAYDYAGAVAAIGDARAKLDDPAAFEAIKASCLSEMDESVRAQAIFDRLPIPADGDAAIPVLRNLIRLGRFEHALQLANLPFAAGDRAVWPYRALLWRVTNDTRWQWLEGDARLIQSYDISGAIGSLPALAECLRDMHKGSAQPLEQSVRGGTQTDGMLFARAEPEIRRLRVAVLDAVGQYVAQLPPADPHHPTLIAKNSPLRFEGAWSVRLSDAGFHSDHVHTRGWISSAFYVALPETMSEGEDGQAGWLTFGENHRLLPDLPAFHVVEPKPGHLTLFPSTMWHGTRPFSAGERLTVAFDIAMPKPS